MENIINDCYIEVFGKKPTKKKIKEIKDSLPREILITAQEWGEYDTVVGDEICAWIRRHKELQ
jgi:hypothetical protein